MLQRYVYTERLSEVYDAVGATLAAIPVSTIDLTAVGLAHEENPSTPNRSSRSPSTRRRSRSTASETTAPPRPGYIIGRAADRSTRRHGRRRREALGAARGER